jgi:hypothetical protein
LVQDERPIIGTLPGDPPAPGQDLPDLAPEVIREEPSYGLFISELQNALDDIFFILLKIEASHVGIPEQGLVDVFSLIHYQYYITFERRAELAAGAATPAAKTNSMTTNSVLCITRPSVFAALVYHTVGRDEFTF